MKTNFWLLFLLVPVLSWGQSYESLVDSGKMWSNLVQNSSGGPPPYIKATSFCRFDDDTLIGSFVYKHIYRAFDSIHASWAASNSFIREDSSGSVFMTDRSGSTQILLYDFNAQVGDTLGVNNCGPLVVGSIDTVFIADKLRKRISLFIPGKPAGETWIEGMGSLCGVLSSGTSSVLGSSYDLLCYYESNILKYSNPDYSDCYYNNSGIGESSPHTLKVSISPNPVTSESLLTIEQFRNISDYFAEVYSGNGMKVALILFNNAGQAFIKKSDYTSGLYLYRIITDGAMITSGKFIIP